MRSLTSMNPLAIHLSYFPILREQRGRPDQKLALAAASPAALREELRAHHGFNLSADRVLAAKSDKFFAAIAPLRNGDRIVFIPTEASG